MSSGLKHNKKRSTAIVYELLVRKISERLIEGDKRGAAFSLSLLKRYFSPNTPIGMELETIDAMRNSRGLNQALASRVLIEVKAAAAKLDRRLIDIKKSNLIKELNHNFGQEFFSSFRLPEYKALASMQVFVESCGKNITLSEGLERAQIETAIMNYMMSTATTSAPVYDPDRNAVSYSMALEKFERKHGSSLSKPQKSLLEQYVAALFSGDFKKFKAHAAEDQRKIYRTIVGSITMNECKGDDVLKQRLNEAAKKLKDLKVSTDESFVSEMMLFHDLSSEITSNV